ncbi:MAG: hypothetical protein KA714_19860 [Limnoraphis sp. WC205]|nr:hypothetical protein [Limnoraphis sp. WC205]
MTYKFSISVSDEIAEVMKLALDLSGKSQNAACTQWIMEGALREIALFKKAELLKKPSFPHKPPSTDNEPEE